MTSRQHLLAITVIVALAVGGCKPSADPANAANPSATSSTPPTTEATVARPAADLDALIAKQGSVTFRSWNGKWIGMDCDTDLTFLPGGAAHMFEYGLGVSGYGGTYSIDGKGDVTTLFPAFKHPWPLMTLGRDSTSLLLQSKDPADEFVMGNRGGATIIGGQGTYWPFRPLTAAEETHVSERIAKRK